MKLLYWRSVNSKGAGRPRLSHHHRGWWKEMNETSVEKWWHEICGRGKREKSRDKHSQTLLRPLRNHMDCPRCELGTPAQRWETSDWLSTPRGRPAMSSMISNYYLRLCSSLWMFVYEVNFTIAFYFIAFALNFYCNEAVHWLKNIISPYVSGSINI